ncbi:MAG: hypothetical protein LUI14_08350 [Lachnospiraceae bacterium]|nr:hypothetical protein [Lachnospiraceae bacterium]
MARERRSKKEVIAAKMDQIDEKINGYATKIADLQNQKEELESQLAELSAAEKKAEEEAQVKELMKIMKEKNISAGELKAMVENKN